MEHKNENPAAVGAARGSRKDQLGSSIGSNSKPNHFHHQARIAVVDAHLTVQSFSSADAARAFLREARS